MTVWRCSYCKKGSRNAFCLVLDCIIPNPELIFARPYTRTKRYCSFVQQYALSHYQDTLYNDYAYQIDRSVFYSLPTLLLHTHHTVTFIWNCNMFLLYCIIVSFIVFWLYYCTFCVLHYATCIRLGYWGIFSNPAVQLIQLSSCSAASMSQ